MKPSIEPKQIINEVQRKLCFSYMCVCVCVCVRACVRVF